MRWISLTTVLKVSPPRFQLIMKASPPAIWHRNQPNLLADDFHRSPAKVPTFALDLISTNYYQPTIRNPRRSYGQVFSNFFVYGPIWTGIGLNERSPQLTGFCIPTTKLAGVQESGQVRNSGLPYETWCRCRPSIPMHFVSSNVGGQLKDTPAGTPYL